MMSMMQPDPPCPQHLCTLLLPPPPPPLLLLLPRLPEQALASICEFPADCG
jgi:hypothetical protein